MNHDAQRQRTGHGLAIPDKLSHFIASRPFMRLRAFLRKTHQPTLAHGPILLRSGATDRIDTVRDRQESVSSQPEPHLAFSPQRHYVTQLYTARVTQRPGE